MTDREHIRMLLTILRNQAVFMHALKPLASDGMQLELTTCIHDTEDFIHKLREDYDARDH